MESTPNISPAHFQELAHRIDKAVQQHDWDTLKQLDMTIGNVLKRYPSCLQDAAFRREITQLKLAHRNAFIALTQAASELQKKLQEMQSQQERAKAYQFAMTNEY